MVLQHELRSRVEKEPHQLLFADAQVVQHRVAAQRCRVDIVDELDVFGDVGMARGGKDAARAESAQHLLVPQCDLGDGIARIRVNQRLVQVHRTA